MPPTPPKHSPNNAIRAFAGRMPSLASRVYIDPQACVIGDVAIGEDSSVWPMAVIRGDVQSIRIGARTSVQDGAVLHVTHAGPYSPEGNALHIGDDCIIGHNVTLHGCTLENQVLVGMGAIVMDATTVQSQVVIAAGSLVPSNKVLESGYLYRGSPAKKSRALSDQEIAFFTYSANNYVALKNSHLSP